MLDVDAGYFKNHLRETLSRSDYGSCRVGSSETSKVRKNSLQQSENAFSRARGCVNLVQDLRFILLRPFLQGYTSGCGEPPIDFKTKVPSWPGQNKTFVLMITGGSSQPDVSPCIVAQTSLTDIFDPDVLPAQLWNSESGLDGTSLSEFTDGMIMGLRAIFRNVEFWN